MNPQADQLSPDIISSTLPPFIIETILCLVPIEEAARTSILSKEWRYKWTKIPKLDFDEYLIHDQEYSSTDHDDHENQMQQTMASERDMMSKRCKLFNAIFQVLLMCQAPIHEFSLHLEVDKTCVEIDQVLSYLSRNSSSSLKKLTLELFDDDGEYYRVPLSLFKFQHLTYLHLSECDLNIQTTPSGFPSLTRLCLKNVYISIKNLLHILSNSPRLEHFTLCLVIEDSDQQELPTSVLIHLKYFCMKFKASISADDLRFLAFLLRSSPNLEKIKLRGYDSGVDDDINGYSDIWMEHLNELEILDM